MIRIFSIKRILLSTLLGFLLPVAYAFILSEASDYTRKPPPDYLVIPFGWPRPLWVFLIGRQPTDSDVIPGLLFFAACNVLLYGSLVYAALTMWPVLRGKRADYGSPPPPEQPGLRTDELS